VTGPVDIGWTRAARRPARSRFELAWDAIRALGPVHAIAVLIAIAGLVMYVNDGPTIASAKELTRSGVAATATSSEVLLVKGSGGRGGPYAALDSVRAHRRRVGSGRVGVEAAAVHRRPGSVRRRLAGADLGDRVCRAVRPGLHHSS